MGHDRKSHTPLLSVPLSPQTMLTPKRSVVATSRSVTNTPFRRADSDPVKHPLTFTQIKSAPSSPHPPHPPTIPESTDQTERVSIPVPRKVLGGQSRTMSSVGVNTNISGDFPGPNEAFSELNIEGALTDELKLLQVENWNICVGGKVV